MDFPKGLARQDIPKKPLFNFGEMKKHRKNSTAESASSSSSTSTIKSPTSVQPKTRQETAEGSTSSLSSSLKSPTTGQTVSDPFIDVVDKTPSGTRKLRKMKTMKLLFSYFQLEGLQSDVKKGDEKKGDKKKGKSDETVKTVGQKIEHDLRLQIKSPLIPREVIDPNGPKHPHHGYKFNHRNLWCTMCEGHCNICSSTCCALYEVREELKACENGKDKRRTERLMHHGKKILFALEDAAGRDPPVFVYCEECKKMACPNCISQCPSKICQAWECIKCKPAKGTPCDWHADLE